MEEGLSMHKIRYISRINKRGWFGIPYTVWKVRTAHVDERNWRRLRNRPFSMSELMMI